MKRILAFLLLIASFSLFEGCITDTKTQDTDTDSTQVGPNGARKPRTPKVSYIVVDSLVFIRIIGSGIGQEDAYWIRRDGKLLEQPVLVGGDSVQYLYALKDSLTEIGVYKYTVQFGTHLDSLSDKSPEYAYDYAGHSRSGLVRAYATEEQLVSLTVMRPADEVLGAFIIERKIGSGGKVIALDTVELNAENFEYFLDTSLVPEDAYLYYRVKAMNALTEEFLPPSPWDSVLVKNKVWKYVPSVQFTLSESGIAAVIANPLTYPDNGTAYYYLYRNATAEKSGKHKVDSLPLSGLYLGAALNDHPDSGAHYYWVETRDPWGRISARSAPKLLTFTGRAMGPAVEILQMSQGILQIQPYFDPQAAYYILQRCQDTAKTVTTLDTLIVPDWNSFGTPFIDRPTVDGYYFYRVITLRKNGQQTDPGAWGRSGFHHYEPIYGQFSATIANRGDRVQAQVERTPDAYYILVRSKTASGPDTGTVDTLRYSESSSTLQDTPPLGTWYYSVLRYPSSPNSGSDIYRSVSTRIDFTGKAVGPAITALNVYSTRIDVGLAVDSDALAYILERSADGKSWTTVDTVSALDISIGQLRDTPPADGFWNYRARSINKNMTLSEPGTPMRTLSLFTFGPQYDNTLNAYLENKGARLDFPMYGAYNYVFYLMRSDKPEWKDGKRVDSLKFDDFKNALSNTPPKGIWYFWVQRESTVPGNADIISRSAPIRVEFTGSPEITTLSKSAQGIQLTFPYTTGPDTLEIHRSSGNPDDLKGYVLLGSVAASSFTTSYFDATVAGKTGFYHYRLATRTAGTRSDLGAAKSVYYEAGTGTGISQGLLKQAAGVE